MLYVTLVMGQLLAQAVLLILLFVFLTHEQLEAWGWRIPFVIGALAALGGLYLRRISRRPKRFRSIGQRAAGRRSAPAAGVSA